MADTAKKNISIDELLDQQKQAQFVATVEPTDDPDTVKITPFVPNVGCLCETAFRVPKTAIESVTPTGQRHLCCGKNLIVVEVKFKDGATLPVSQIFEQQFERAAESQLHWPAGHTGSRVALQFGAVDDRPFPQSNMHGLGSDDITGYDDSSRFYPHHRRPQGSCEAPYRYCSGSCGASCYEPSIETCMPNGMVCRPGDRTCGCRCYDPSVQGCSSGRLHWL